MKKWMSLIVCLCLLTFCAYAEWNETKPIGNDRVGYFMPDTPWLPFISINKTAEQLAKAEADYGFTQYFNLDHMAILSISIFSGMLDETEAENDDARINLILEAMNSDFTSVSNRMLEPQWWNSLENNLVPGHQVGVLEIYDTSEEATEANVVIFYLIDNTDLYHFEFEQVYDEDALQAIVDLVSTWTLVLPDV